MYQRQQIYRLSSKKLNTPEGIEPTKDWFIPDFSKKIVRVEMRKYKDGEILVDLILEHLKETKK